MMLTSLTPNKFCNNRHVATPNLLYGHYRFKFMASCCAACALAAEPSSLCVSVKVLTLNVSFIFRE